MYRQARFAQIWVLQKGTWCMELSKTKPDILPDIQLQKCRVSIGMALAAYSPGETHSSSGVLYVIYGEYMWVYLGFTPCATVRATLEEEYNATFGKIIPVKPSANQEKAVEPLQNQEPTCEDRCFAYGTPFVGIPLPR